MLNRLVVILAFGAAACGGSSAVTGVGVPAAEPAVVAASPTPAPVASPSPTPSPEPGPAYWRASVDDYAGLNHTNVSGHTQHAVECIYRANTLLGATNKDVRPHTTERLWAMPTDAWSWHATEILVLGLVGSERKCTATPQGIGNITVRRTLAWMGQDGCFAAMGCR